MYFTTVNSNDSYFFINNPFFHFHLILITNKKLVKIFSFITNQLVILNSQLCIILFDEKFKL